MRDTQQAFVQAILDQPDDDALRLVYADWLDEHGQPERAEFIRVQIELERFNPSHSEFWDLKTRETDLLIDHGATWLEEVPRVVRDHSLIEELCYLNHFRRGFLTNATLKPGTFHQIEEVLRLLPLRNLTVNLDRVDAHELATWPFLARPWALTIFTDAERLSVLLGSSHLPGRLMLHHASAAVVDLLCRSSASGRVHSLGWEPTRGQPQQVQQFAASAWDRLESLTLFGQGVDATAMQHLARSPHLAQLTSLRFDDCEEITPPGWQALAQSGHLPKLQHLSLQRCYLEPAAWSELAQGTNWPALRELFICGALGRASMEQMLQAPWMPQIRILNFSGCRLTDESMAQLLGSSNFAGVRCLELYSNPEAGDATTTALANSQYADHLFALMLGCPNITDEGIKRLANSENLRQVRHLHLFCHLTNAGMIALARSRYVKNLRQFTASGQVGDKGVEALCAAPWLGRIENLKLSSKAITDTSAQALARSPGVANLRWLDLSDAGIGHAGAAALAQSPCLARLGILQLNGNSIGDSGALALADSPYLERLVCLGVSRRRLSDKAIEALRNRFGTRLVFSA